MQEESAPCPRDPKLGVQPPYIGSPVADVNGIPIVLILSSLHVALFNGLLTGVPEKESWAKGTNMQLAAGTRRLWNDHSHEEYRSTGPNDREKEIDHSLHAVSSGICAISWDGWHHTTYALSNVRIPFCFWHCYP